MNFPDETLHLAETNRRLERALREAKEAVGRIDIRAMHRLTLLCSGEPPLIP